MRINQTSPVNTNYGMDRPVESPKTAEVAKAQQRPAPQRDKMQQEAVKQKGEEPAFNEELVDKSIDQANKTLAMNNRVIERAVHEVTGTVMYTVKDTATHEVIAEFPPKRIQDMIAKMWELAGLFVDEKA